MNVVKKWQQYFEHKVLSIMRVRLKGIIRFGLLLITTVFLTVVIFRLIHQPPTEQYSKLQGQRARKIDWHDHTLINLEKKRRGIGEQGLKAELPPNYDVARKQQLYSVNGFNALLSDYISLNRSLKDIRHPGCQYKKYWNVLPTVSVIVPFHNEHWTTLLRTSASVILRSPKKLLVEIILVDDKSTKPELGSNLTSYLAEHYPIVRVIRLDKRSGLIIARLAGAKEAKGEVLIFLDSHSEANVNWLPPLLDPIAEDYRTCVCPFIDVIAYDTFEYRAQDEGARGAFDWEFFYKRLPLLPEDLKRPTEPFKSPVMAGGLFAISKRFFWELGGYDPGLEIWGGEQYELSFKIWMCGGQMVDAPCSRVGHIYREFGPFPNPGRGDFVGRNYRRVAEVWMDEYKNYLYKRRPHYLAIDPGDITERKQLRNKLKCKSFEWYMKNIAFDLVKRYPPVEPEDFFSGKVRSKVNEKKCVDSSGKSENQQITIADCASRKEQEFIMTWRYDIRISKRKNLCWDVSSSEERAPVNLFMCHSMGGNQRWSFDKAAGKLTHGGNKQCLELDPDENQLFVSTCKDGIKTQEWTFG